MSIDLPTLDTHTLDTVCGGSKETREQLKVEMTRIKDSLSTLKKQATSSSSDPMMTTMMMMMMMRR